MAVMPMFPLGTVLLPGGVLPLHVFEPRYRQLVIDCLADDTGDPEFGVTMIERGSEVGGGDQRSDVGVVARMVQVQALDDGRYAVGRRRHPADPRPRLAARRPVPAGRRRRLARRRRRRRRAPARVAELTSRLADVLAVAAQLGEVPADVDLDAVSRRPARRLLPPRRAVADRPRRPLPAAVRRRAPAERLDLLAECLDDVEAMLRFRLTDATRLRPGGVHARTCPSG